MSSRGAPRFLAPAILGTVVALAAANAAGQASGSGQPGMTYASLADLPDWSGWWLADVASTAAADLAGRPPPLRPEALQARRAALAEETPDPLRHCRPWQFTGSSGGFTEALEFLFTPGRVTLTNERGLIRRIYTDGRPMPENLEFTNSGTSIGHWDGDTLVVETAGIDPRSLYPTPGAGAIPFGRNVVITERIRLTDEGTLQFEVETVAPDIFSSPDRRTRTYQRLAKTMGNEISFCSEFDRSVEPGTGRQRFDLTPPPDLPPPPPR